MEKHSIYPESPSQNACIFLLFFSLGNYCILNVHKLIDSYKRRRKLMQDKTEV